MKFGLIILSLVTHVALFGLLYIEKSKNNCDDSVTLKNTLDRKFSTISENVPFKAELDEKRSPRSLVQNEVVGKKSDSHDDSKATSESGMQSVTCNCQLPKKPFWNIPSVMLVLGLLIGLVLFIVFCVSWYKQHNRYTRPARRAHYFWQTANQTSNLENNPANKNSSSTIVLDTMVSALDAHRNTLRKPSALASSSVRSTNGM